jgi:hypothetical protein
MSKRHSAAQPGGAVLFETLLSRCQSVVTGMSTGLRTVVSESGRCDMWRERAIPRVLQLEIQSMQWRTRSARTRRTESIPFRSFCMQSVRGSRRVPSRHAGPRPTVCLEIA